MSAVGSRIELCAAADVEAGKALKVEVHGFVLAVFNLDGDYYVTDDTCTHGPGSLSEGFIEGDEVECDFHNGKFNIKTGAVAAPPCMIPIKTYPAVVEDGRVWIES
ncbi:MAG: non-heme iron oxygenase ferredoxin subunit [Rhodospirillales bacterium]|jgi:nitrite reductase/ring-hydroxylating ferredoxin subunit